MQWKWLAGMKATHQRRAQTNRNSLSAAASFLLVFMHVAVVQSNQDKRARFQMRFCSFHVAFNCPSMLFAAFQMTLLLAIASRYDFPLRLLKDLHFKMRKVL